MQLFTKIPIKILLILLTPILLSVVIMSLGILQLSQTAIKNDSLPKKTISSETPSTNPIPITPQVFAGNENEGTGVLRVSAKQSGVFIYIDTPPGAHADAPTTTTPDRKPVPAQYTPFIIQSLPIGSHSLTAVKPGYTAQTKKVVIKAGEESTILFDLIPWK